MTTSYNDAVAAAQAVSDELDKINDAIFALQATVATLSAGTVPPVTPLVTPPTTSPQETNEMGNAQIGWEVNPINNNGQNYCVGPTTKPVTLVGLHIDVAFVPSQSTPGSADILAYGAVLSQKPTFGPGPSYFIGGLTQDPALGPTTAWPDVPENPTNGNCLFACILKSQCPAATSRHICTSYNWLIPAGSYFVFHMDHAGMPGDAEMQGLIQYK